MLTVQLVVTLLVSLFWTTAMSADHPQPDESFTRVKGSLTSAGLYIRDSNWKRKDNLADVRPDTESLTIDLSGLTHQGRLASEVVKKFLRQNLLKRHEQNTDSTLPGQSDRKYAPYFTLIKRNRGGGVLRRQRRGVDRSESLRRDLGRAWKRAASLPGPQPHSSTDFVKRDTSLITPNCGSLGNRCRLIQDNRCVRMCVDGYMRTVCRAQREGVWGCYITTRVA